MLNASMLLNLDSEDDAEIFVGCAGGVDTTCLFTYNRSFAPTDFHYFKLDISGGLGGHSGGDIHLGRANANKLLARFLYNYRPRARNRTLRNRRRQSPQRNTPARHTPCSASTPLARNRCA